MAGADLGPSFVLTGTVAEWIQFTDSLSDSVLDDMLWTMVEEQIEDYPVEAVVDVVFSRVSQETVMQKIQEAGITFEQEAPVDVDEETTSE